MIGSNEKNSDHGYHGQWYAVALDWVNKWKIHVSSQQSHVSKERLGTHHRARHHKNESWSIYPGPIDNTALYEREGRL